MSRLSPRGIGLRYSVPAVVMMVAVAVDGASASADASPLPAVCEIAQHPELFDGKVVRIAGVVKSDGLENTLIVDPACPDTGIGFKYSERASKSVAAQRLDKAIYFTGTPGTKDKEITVTLAGKFAWNSKGGPPRLIVVDKVSHLVVNLKSR